MTNWLLRAITVSATILAPLGTTTGFAQQPIATIPTPQPATTTATAPPATVGVPSTFVAPSGFGLSSLVPQHAPAPAGGTVIIIINGAAPPAQGSSTSASADLARKLMDLEARQHKLEATIGKLQQQNEMLTEAVVDIKKMHLETLKVLKDMMSKEQPIPKEPPRKP